MPTSSSSVSGGADPLQRQAALGLAALHHRDAGLPPLASLVGHEAIDRNYAAHLSFIDYLFGTAVRVSRRLPENYGILDNDMPGTFLAQQAYPFRRNRPGRMRESSASLLRATSCALAWLSISSW